MSSVSLPRVSFSKWVELTCFEEELVQIPKGRMGLYLISLKPKNFKQTTRTSFLEKDIIYIGMTTSGLRGRVSALCRAVRRKKASHSGGHRIADYFGKYGGRSHLWKKKALFISYWAPYEERKRPKSKQDFFNMGTITYLEYNLLGRFYKVYGHTPECNAKRKGDSLGSQLKLLG